MKLRSHPTTRTGEASPPDDDVDVIVVRACDLLPEHHDASSFDEDPDWDVPKRATKPRNDWDVPELADGPKAAARKKFKLVAKREIDGRNRQPMDSAFASNAVEYVVKRRKLKLRLRGRPVEVIWDSVSLNAHRMIEILLHRVDSKTHERFYPLECTVLELKRLLHLSPGYRLKQWEVENLLIEVRMSGFNVRDGSKFITMSAVNTAEWNKVTGKIKMELHPKLGDYFLGLDFERGDFYKTPLTIIDLGTTRAMRLCRFLCHYVGLTYPLRGHSIPLEKIYEVMAADRSMPWKDFHKRIFKPALADIKEKVKQLKVKYTPECGKHGKVGSLRFRFGRQQKLLPFKSKLSIKEEHAT